MKKWVVAYSILTALYAFFSYGFVLPNLILSQNSLYMQFQWWMWDHIFVVPAVRVAGFLTLVILMWCVYLLLLKTLSTTRLTGKKILLLVALIIASLLFSYNALSADVFNYIFNAKMLTQLGSNPHVQTAFDFPAEPMLNFMHNAHSPAPYGYAWTFLSSPFYFLGLGKFILQWLAMKLAALLSFALTGFVLYKMIGKNNQKRWWLVAFLLNPLIILEFISNLHNDLWMMGLGLLSLYLIKLKTTFPRPLLIIFSFLSLLISINIKFATIIFLPVWLWFIFGAKIKSSLTNKTFLSLINLKEKYLWDILAIVFFLPLLLPRSQQFLPWYLSWSLVFLPLMNNKWLRLALICFSASSLLRYLPWLFHSGYLSEQRTLETAITFGASLVFFLIVYFIDKLKLNHARRQN
ncbi:hypothetical protein FWH30_02530 [Microgenomates group bacterium]|nr:hypothetical protein [Microgenomates group bacterium]